MWRSPVPQHGLTACGASWTCALASTCRTQDGNQKENHTKEARQAPCYRALESECGAGRSVAESKFFET